MKLTTVQALRLLKTLREEQTRAIDDIAKASIPTKVDGVKSVSEGREAEAYETIEKVKNITEDIINLRNAIDASNKEHNLNESTNELQELRKIENKLGNMEMYALRNVGNIEVSDNGNLIEYEMLGKDEYDEMKDTNKKRAEQLQDKLDQANSTNIIEIELKTR